jgi:hypothetical protein
MNSIIQHLIITFSYVIDSLDWVYLVMFMITCYVILKGLDVPIANLRKRNKLSSWLFRTRRIVLFVGFIYAVLFGICKIFWGLPWHNPDVNLPYGYIVAFSFIIGQFLNLYGIEAVVNLIIDAVKGVLKRGVKKFENS